MVLYTMDDGVPEPFTVTFNEVVGEIPQVVTKSNVGDIIPDLLHIQWAMTDGRTTFLDTALQLRVEPEAIVVDSFFDPSSSILQIRSSFSLSRKIAREWAKINNKVFEQQVQPRGLTTLAQVHDFCDAISGRVRKCTGDRLESQGFSRVSGLRAQGYEDLRGTPDYEEFVAAVDMVESQIEFDHEGDLAVIGIGLQTRSVVFMTAVNELVINFVYSSLKSFLNL